MNEDDPLNAVVDEIGRCLATTMNCILSGDFDGSEESAEFATESHAPRIKELSSRFSIARSEIESDGAASIVQSTEILDEATHLVRFAHQYLVANSYRPGGPTVTAVSVLLRQMVRVAGEINCLLRNGFPDGATARSRTMVELATTLKLLAIGNSHTAHRWLRHLAYLQLKQIQALDQDQLEQVDPTRIAALENDHKKAIRSYGSTFAGPYGWAHELVRRKLRRTSKKWNPKFHELLEVAKFDRFAGFVRHSHNFVHADSLGVAKALSGNEAGEVSFEPSAYLLNIVVDSMLSSVWALAAEHSTWNPEGDVEADALVALLDEIRVDLLVRCRWIEKS